MCIRDSLQGGHVNLLVLGRSAGRAVDRGGDVDIDVLALDADREDIQGGGGGRGPRDAGAQVELRAVQPALDQAALDLALGCLLYTSRCV